jgi:hypothetical protein
MKFILYLFHIRCPKEIDRMRWVDPHFTCLSGSLSVDPQIESDKALFGTRVLVGIGEDNPLEYWVKPPPSPNSHKTPPTIH